MAACKIGFGHFSSVGRMSAVLSAILGSLAAEGATLGRKLETSLRRFPPYGFRPAPLQVVECPPSNQGLPCYLPQISPCIRGEAPFENVSVKSATQPLRLIGANGCGKSTFMKILGRDLEQSSAKSCWTARAPGQATPGSVCLRRHPRARRGDDGPREMWEAMAERDAIYANSDASERTTCAC